MQDHINPDIRPADMFQVFLNGNTGRIPRGFTRQAAFIAQNINNGDARFVAARQHNFITWLINGKAENIETTGHISDSGRGKNTYSFHSGK